MSERTIRVITDANETVYVTKFSDDGGYFVVALDEDGGSAQLRLTEKDVEMLSHAFHGEVS